MLNTIKKNVGEGEQKLHRKDFSGFLKTDTEGDNTRGAGNLFQYLTTRTENASLVRQKRLGHCSYPLSPARGEQRKKSDGLRSITPLIILKARMRRPRSREKSLVECLKFLITITRKINRRFD